MMPTKYHKCPQKNICVVGFEAPRIVYLTETQGHFGRLCRTKPPEELGDIRDRFGKQSSDCREYITLLPSAYTPIESEADLTSEMRLVMAAVNYVSGTILVLFS